MKISTDKDCNFIIHDDIEYPVYINKYCLPYSDSISLYIIKKHTTESENIVYKQFYPHEYAESTVDKYVLVRNFIPGPTIDGVVNNELYEDWPVISDKETGEQIFIIENRPVIKYQNSGGWYTIYHVIIPVVDNTDEQYIREHSFIHSDTIDDIDNISGTPTPAPTGQPTDSPDNSSNDSPEDSTLYRIIYNDKGEIVRLDDGEKVEIQELLNIIETDNNNISRNFEFEKEEFFLDCFLKKCYMNLCRQIFKSTAFDRCFVNKVDSQLIYKRDLTWAALNTITFLVEQGNYIEAQRLLEQINGCRGLCPDDGNGTSKNCGCNGML